MRLRWIGLLLAGLLAAVPAVPLVAGEKEKCPYPVEQCLEYIRTTMKNSGWVGVALDFDKDAGGWVLSEVVPGSPAENVGLKVGDVLIAANGVRADDEKSEAMWEAHRKTKAGDTAVWEIRRDGKVMKIEIVLAPMPADLLAKYIGEHLRLHEKQDQAAIDNKP